MKKIVPLSVLFCVSLWFTLNLKDHSLNLFNLNLLAQTKDIKNTKTNSSKIESINSNVFNNQLLKVKNKGWLYALAIVFFSGIATSLTPCVLPMIPITLSMIGTRKTHSKKEAFLLSLVYVLGIAFVYSSIGLFASLTGSLFGSLLGHPIVAISFALIFILLALSLFGCFEIQLPNSIRQKMHQYSLKLNQKKLGLTVLFLSGALAGVIASPCVGPILSALLLYVAKAQDPVFGFILLFTFSLGLGQLFLFLGVFGQRIFPKIGHWMKKIQYLLGFFLLLLAFQTVYPLIKKESFLGLKIFSQKDKEEFKTHIPKKEIIYGHQWVLFSKKALEQAKKDKKPVIIDFYATWCVACVRLERKTFKDPDVLKAGQDFLWLKLDVTKPSKKERQILKEFDVFGLPTILLFDSKGNRREDLTLRGYEKPSLFIKRMKKLETLEAPKEKEMDKPKEDKNVS